MHDLEIHKSTELYPGQEKISCHSCTQAIIRRPWESSSVWRSRKKEFIVEHPPNKATERELLPGAQLELFTLAE